MQLYGGLLRGSTGQFTAGHLGGCGCCRPPGTWNSLSAHDLSHSSPLQAKRQRRNQPAAAAAAAAAVATPVPWGKLAGTEQQEALAAEEDLVNKEQLLEAALELEGSLSLGGSSPSSDASSTSSSSSGGSGPVSRQYLRAYQQVCHALALLSTQCCAVRRFTSGSRAGTAVP